MTETELRLMTAAKMGLKQQVEEGVEHGRRPQYADGVAEEGKNRF
jgi:hypothetical protein